MENTKTVKSNSVAIIDSVPTIENFVAALNAGIEQWESAGRILVALRQSDGDAFKSINKAYPFITIDTLEVFYHIGTRTIYPLIVLLPRHVFKSLREMKYETQVEICSNPVQVVTRIDREQKPVVMLKPVAQMSAEECKNALWRKGNFSVKHQAEQLQLPPDINKMLPKPVVDVKRVANVVGRYSVRRAPGGGFCFEKTGANTFMTQRVMLHDGQALIELAEYPK